MKTWQGFTDEELAETAQSGYKSAQFLTQAVGYSGLAAWPGLELLAEQLEELLSAESPSGSSLGREMLTPYSLRQLSMLEAELLNQRILPKIADAGLWTVSQHASMELSHLRWRARRRGIHASELEFAIHLPNYLLYLGKEVERKLCSRDPQSFTDDITPVSFGLEIEEDARTLREKLRYLDQFARYLSGSHQRTQNGFSRGLSLVLRVLGKTDFAAGRREKLAASGKRRIILPVSRAGFLQQLTSTR